VKEMMQSERASLTPTTGTGTMRRKKRSLTDALKNQIYQFHKDNPLVTHSNIAGMSHMSGLRALNVG
jgi:hypothetical protein